MNHRFSADDVRRVFHGNDLPPLRTVTELAKEFGVTRHSLSGYLGNRKPAPKPVFRHRYNTWYDPEEVRKWWKNLIAEGVVK
jgi:hypothetical protein